MTAGDFRVYQPALPEVCPRDPRRMVLAADADGRCEIFTWQAATGTARQVTDSRDGTLHCAIDADARVWWFAEDRNGRGRWYFEEFEGGGPRRPGLTGLRPGLPHGLAVSDAGTVAIGLGDGRGTTVHIGTPGGPARPVATVDGPALLAGISPSGGLLALSGPAGSERAVTLLTCAGAPLDRLSGRHGRLWPLGFAPSTAGTELLLVQECGPESATPDEQQDIRQRTADNTPNGRYRLASWRPGSGLQPYDWCCFDTEITGRWYPEGRRVLIRQDRHGRSTLVVADLDRRTLNPVPTPPGTVLDAVPHPGDDVHYLWTDTATPPRMRSTAGTRLPALATLPGRAPGRHGELWTDGPDGPVHTLLSRPDPGPGGCPPLVFLVHGGPADHARDAYDPEVHSLVASGFAVARVNYRGSTGYGPRWGAAFGEGVGLTQVADLVAVRADLLRRGLAREDAIGLWGTSWGGYLALLALGTRPGLWQAGVAVKPVADCAAAHRSGTPALRALDERLFGGTPDTVPERYARSSPLHYAAEVRAPLLVVAATLDAKCPPGQVRGYLTALREAGVAHESLWLETGHDGYTGAHHMTVLSRAVRFLDRHLRRSGTAHRAPCPSVGGVSGETGASGVPGLRGPIPDAVHRQNRRSSHAEGHHPQRPARG
ncbi:prolyl oligopeptidase family serine peptidase [Streptomyces lydicus]|uniref:S9 family peptidase n=1 Tax=Streptomyces lydicus TaxID=47763 RepID=UPI002E3061D7|nr:prolyl oligopeptidase family serine peptidase [Streptomyces lydicus]